MFNKITRFFESPEDKDPSFVRIVRNILIYTLIVTVLTLVIEIIITAATSRMAEFAVTLSILAFSAVLVFIALLYLLRGNILAAKVFLPIIMIFTVTIAALDSLSFHDISIIAYPFIIIIATLLQGRRARVTTTPLVIGALGLLGVLDQAGLTKSEWGAATDEIVIGMLLLWGTAGILNLLVGRLNLAIKKARESEQALQLAKEALETQVKVRPAELSRANEQLQIELAERKNAEEKLVYTALHDPLTNLSNRVLFMDHLRFAMERAKRHIDFRFAVLFLDLDRFKVVNDSLGHNIGNLLLIESAHRLAACMRSVDTVARLGGDEFVILLEDIQNPMDATLVADRIQHDLEDHNLSPPA